MTYLGPRDCEALETKLDHVREIFRLHGITSCIETPVIELLGPGSEVHLRDQGGQLCCLRPSLRESFARYAASRKLRYLRAYQIGKVYHRSTSGNPLETYQISMDMLCEDPLTGDALAAECVKILDQILSPEIAIVTSTRLIPYCEAVSCSSRVTFRDQACTLATHEGRTVARAGRYSSHGVRAVGLVIDVE